MALKTRPTVQELFAGAGLLSHAFEAEGFKVTRAIEIDPVAAETYRMNLGSHVEVADVTRVNPEGRCDVLVAGPPCQGFSTLGKRNPDDPRNLLSLAVLPWARSLQPHTIVVENVAAFLDSPAAASLMRGLRRAGYCVRPYVLNAFDFGVPQIRHRCFVIASQSEPAPLEPLHRPFARTISEAWEGLASVPDGRNGHYAPEPSPLALARMRVIPEGGDRRDVMSAAPAVTPPSWWRLRSQVTDSWGRLRWNRPSNTLRTCLQNASKGRYIHPDQNRVISLREAARIHSVDDGWQFHGLPTQVARQIGNSVPVWLGRAVARAAMATLN